MIETIPPMIDHIRMRAEMGRKRYGTYLKTNNGRNSLIDAYQEALDLCVYLRQAIDDLPLVTDLPDDYPVKEEPAPVDNGGKAVYELVIHDLQDPMFLSGHYMGLRETYRLALMTAIQIRLQIEDRHWLSTVRSPFKRIFAQQAEGGKGG